MKRAEEMGPAIRYCAHNLGDTSAIDDLIRMRMESGAHEEMISQLDVSFARSVGRSVGRRAKC